MSPEEFEKRFAEHMAGRDDPEEWSIALPPQKLVDFVNQIARAEFMLSVAEGPSERRLAVGMFAIAAQELAEALFERPRTLEVPRLLVTALIDVAERDVTPEIFERPNAGRGNTGQAAFASYFRATLVVCVEALIAAGLDDLSARKEVAGLVNRRPEALARYRAAIGKERPEKVTPRLLLSWRRAAAEKHRDQSSPDFGLAALGGKEAYAGRLEQARADVAGLIAHLAAAQQFSNRV